MTQQSQLGPFIGAAVFSVWSEGDGGRSVNPRPLNFVGQHTFTLEVV